MSVPDRGGSVGPLMTFVDHVRPDGALGAVPAYVSAVEARWDAWTQIHKAQVTGPETGWGRLGHKIGRYKARHVPPENPSYNQT